MMDPLLCWRWLNTCQTMGSGKLIPCVTLLVCAAFALLTELSLSQPMCFLTFILPILSPSTRGREQVTVRV